MMFHGNAHCCGIVELDGITHVPAKEIPRAFYRVLRGGYNGFPFVFFSDHTHDHESGKALVALIKKQKLGKVWGSAPRENPTGSSTLKMYVYQPDWPAVWKWHRRNNRRSR